jgi:hypothetical protein
MELTVLSNIVNQTNGELSIGNCSIESDDKLFTGLEKENVTSHVLPVIVPFLTGFGFLIAVFKKFQVKIDTIV